MSYRASKVNYCYLVVPSRSGAAANILAALKAAGLNLLAFSGFPVGKGKAQLDLVAARLTPIQKLAKTQGWKLSRPKKGFMIQGEDGVGAAKPSSRRTWFRSFVARLMISPALILL